MGVEKTTSTGATFTIPEAGDPNWGQEMHEFLFYLGDALIAGQGGSFSEIIIPTQAITPTSGMALDATGTSLIKLNPASNLTLHATTPIQTPTGGDGKLLILVNVHASNTVTIPDNGNVDINGPVILGPLNILQLVWIDSKSKWIEMSRNN